jgi:hypothetical protein
MSEVYTNTFIDEVVREAIKAPVRDHVRKKYKLPSSTFYSWIKKRKDKVKDNGKATNAAIIALSNADPKTPTTQLRRDLRRVTKAAHKRAKKPTRKPPTLLTSVPPPPPPNKEQMIAAATSPLWAVTYVDPYQDHVVEKFNSEQDALDRAASLSTTGIGHVQVWTNLPFETRITGFRI